jgi:hypothetical protein
MGKRTTYISGEEVQVALQPLIPFLESQGVKFITPTRVCFKYQDKNFYFNPLSGKNAFEFEQFLDDLIINGAFQAFLWRGNPHVNYRLRGILQEYSQQILGVN